MKKYRKKPLVIDAVQWDGYRLEGRYPIAFFKEHNVNWHFAGSNLVIETLEGEMTVRPWDYIIMGIAGELYPVKREIFIDSYEEVKSLELPNQHGNTIKVSLRDKHDE